MVEAGFHIDIGNYKCIIFNDGTLVNEGSENEEVFGLSCILIDSGDQKILVDTGCGGGFQSTAGRLVKNIEAEGIRCADIDRIIFSHGHIDHVSGTFDSHGKPVFPNARYITSEKEWECWVTRPETSELQTMFFEYARNNLLPIREQFELIQDNVDIQPGIKLTAAPGHTPGMMMVDISSGENRLLCIGDIIHSPVEFTNPEYLISFDIAPDQAISTRTRILSDIVKSGTLVFACHFQSPGIGHIVQNEGVFSWEP